MPKPDVANRLWINLNKMIEKIDQSEGVPYKSNLLVTMLLENKLIGIVDLSLSDTRSHIRHAIFDEQKNVISKIIEPKYIAAKQNYYQKKYGLDLNRTRIKGLCLYSQAYLIWRRESTMIQYIQEHCKSICFRAVAGLINEAQLLFPRDNAFLLEDPRIGKRIKRMSLNDTQYLPRYDDVRDLVIQPYEDEVRERLGIKRGYRQGKRTKQQGLPLPDVIEYVVPLYDWYVAQIWRLKQSGQCAQLDVGKLHEKEKALYEMVEGSDLANPRIKACEALIKIEKLPYKQRGAEYLYRLITRASKMEKQIVEQFKNMTF